MNDEELRRTVQHAAQLHGVAPREVVQEGAEPEAAESPVERRRGHRSGWVVSLVVVGALVGLAIVGVMKFVSDPVSSDNKSLKTVRASASPKVLAAADNLLSGLNFQLNYPGVFDQVSQIKSDAQVIEQYRLSSKTNYHRTITVDVRPLVSGGVTDDGSYKIRHLNMNAKYSEVQAKIAGETVYFMTRADNQEKTMFWPHQSKLLTVSATSDDPHDNVPAMMEVVKTSVGWRK